VAAAVWLLALALVRISSVGGLAAAASAPVTALLLDKPRLALLFAAAAVLIAWKHRANISRLIAGTEPKVGQPK